MYFKPSLRISIENSGLYKLPLIKLNTNINAPIKRVFDLARSIDLHQISMSHSDEQAIAGKTEGLISLGESVTWRAKHFGIYHKLSVEIVAFNSPYSFTDRMVKGIFAEMNHEHLFEETTSGTQMQDIFYYKSPFGPLGQLSNLLFLKKYMKNLLQIRNQEIKRIAESEEWKKLLTV